MRNPPQLTGKCLERDNVGPGGLLGPGPSPAIVEGQTFSRSAATALLPGNRAWKGPGNGRESACRELLPQLRQKPLDMPSAALDYRGEFVALRHLHADAGDINVGDLVSPALIDEVPIEADRTARQHDFAVDDGFVAARASAVDPEQLTAEAAEASRIGAHDVF